MAICLDSQYLFAFQLREKIQIFWLNSQTKINLICQFKSNIVVSYLHSMKSMSQRRPFSFNNHMLTHVWRSSDRRFAFMDLRDRVGKLLIVSSSDFLDSGLAVKSHSDSLVGLHKLIEFLGEVFVLDCDDSNMVIE